MKGFEKMAGIFEKVVGSVNKGVATVGTSSKAMIEKAQIKTMISNLESERKELAELLGMKICEKHIQTGEISIDKEIENFVVEIGKRVNGIAEKQAEIKRIDDSVNQIIGSKGNATDTEKTCTCGNIAPPDAKFCAKCGNSV